MLSVVVSDFSAENVPSIIESGALGELERVFSQKFSVTAQAMALRTLNELCKDNKDLSGKIFLYPRCKQLSREHTQDSEIISSYAVCCSHF